MALIFYVNTSTVLRYFYSVSLFFLDRSAMPSDDISNAAAPAGSGTPVFGLLFESCFFVVDDVVSDERCEV